MRIIVSLVAIGLTAVLVGCSQSEPPSSALEINASDVAWAMDWNIWKLECPSSDIAGMQVVVLNEEGDIIFGTGVTMGVAHREGQPTFARVAMKADVKSIQGRVSASGQTHDFHYPDAFVTRKTVIYLAPKLENGMFVLAAETTKSSAGPFVRRVALRWVADLEEGS